MKDINSLRLLIDQKDQELQDILSERTDLILQIGQLKKQQTAEVSLSFRPAREASIMRSLLKRNKGKIPNSMLISIWRDIIASACALQSSFTVGYIDCSHDLYLRDRIRYHFGYTVPIEHFQITDALLEKVKQDKVQLMIMPKDMDFSWLDSLPDSFSIAGELPFLSHNLQEEQKGYFILAPVVSEATGDDKTIISLELAQETNALDSMTILYKSDTQYLIEIDGFIEEKEAIDLFPFVEKIKILGQYPVLDFL